MTQWLEALAVKLDDLNLVPGIRVVGGPPADCPLTSMHVCAHMHVNNIQKTSLAE